MERKKVSIIIPIYNVERYLPECLDSVVQQEYTNLEIILVDDGSTDSSGLICDKYASNDPRIVVIHQKNKGASIAKNTGLNHVTGEYVAFVDSDDFVDLDWIKKMVDSLEFNKADVAECAFTKEYVNFTEYLTDDMFYSKIFSVEEYMEQYLNCWVSSLFWNKLFRSELTYNIRFRNERRCIDDEFYTYKVLSKAKQIVRLEESMYHYRQRASSAVQSNRNREQITDDALEILIERYEWIKKEFPNLSKVYLQHDILMMFYFSNNFLFTKKSVKEFKKVSRYYLNECISSFSNVRLLKNIIVLQMISKKRLLIERDSNANNKCNCYEYYV